MDYIKGLSRDQELLFPKKVDNYITEENPVKFIDVFVNNLDLYELGFKHAKLNKKGRPPYKPSDLLKLYLYGYLNRIRSSRKLETECIRNVEVMWLTKKLKPDFKTIADFRKNNSNALKNLFKEFISFCKNIDLIGGEIVAVDGSKFKAVNSKDKNFNKIKLEKKLKAIDKKIEKYLNNLDKNDLLEKDIKVKKYTKKEIKEKIEEVKKRAKKYNKYLSNLKNSKEKQISVTDPESRLMKTKNGFDVCYNVQTTVDSKNKLIIDYNVTNDLNDCGQLSKMAINAKKILNTNKLSVLADKGYYNGAEVKKCIDNNITPFIPRKGQKPLINKTQKNKFNRDLKFHRENFKYNKEKDYYICPNNKILDFRGYTNHKGKKYKRYLSSKCRTCSFRTKCTPSKDYRKIDRGPHENILEEMEIKVKNNPKIMKKRKQLCEHPFGTIKRNFNQGYFLLKGIEKTSAEISLSTIAYNMTRIFNIVGIKKLIKEINLSLYEMNHNFNQFFINLMKVLKINFLFFQN